MFVFAIEIFVFCNYGVRCNVRDDGQEFGGSLYQRVSPKLETGIQLAWSSGSNSTRFGIGAKYDLDGDASIRTKVNNSSQIGLGYQQRLRDGKLCNIVNEICEIMRSVYLQCDLEKLFLIFCFIYFVSLIFRF